MDDNQETQDYHYEYPVSLQTRKYDQKKHEQDNLISMQINQNHQGQEESILDQSSASKAKKSNKQQQSDFQNVSKNQKIPQNFTNPQHLKNYQDNELNKTQNISNPIIFIKNASNKIQVSYNQVFQHEDTFTMKRKNTHVNRHITLNCKNMKSPQFISGYSRLVIKRSNDKKKNLIQKTHRKSNTINFCNLKTINNNQNTMVMDQKDIENQNFNKNFDYQISSKQGHLPNFQLEVIRPKTELGHRQKDENQQLKNSNSQNLQIEQNSFQISNNNDSSIIQNISPLISIDQQKFNLNYKNCFKNKNVMKTTNQIEDFQMQFTKKNSNSLKRNKNSIIQQSLNSTIVIQKYSKDTQTHKIDDSEFTSRDLLNNYSNNYMNNTYQINDLNQQQLKQEKQNYFDHIKTYKKTINKSCISYSSNNLTQNNNNTSTTATNFNNYNKTTSYNTDKKQGFKIKDIDIDINDQDYQNNYKKIKNNQNYMQNNQLSFNLYRVRAQQYKKNIRQLLEKGFLVNRNNFNVKENLKIQIVDQNVMPQPKLENKIIKDQLEKDINKVQQYNIQNQPKLLEEGNQNNTSLLIDYYNMKYGNQFNFLHEEQKKIKEDIKKIRQFQSKSADQKRRQLFNSQHQKKFTNNLNDNRMTYEQYYNESKKLKKEKLFIFQNQQF